MNKFTVLGSLILAGISCVAAGAELHRSLTESVAVANRSAAVGLTHVEAVELTRRYQQAKPTFSREQNREEAILVRNEIVRQLLRDYLGKRRWELLSPAVVQWYFDKGRADQSFDWLKIPITEEQREKLQAIKLPYEVLYQIQKDRLELMAECLSTGGTGLKFNDVDRAIGEPYVFRSKVLAYSQGVDDYEITPNCESVQVLASPYVQKELECSVDQLKKITELATKYRKLGYVPFAFDGDYYVPPEELQRIRLQAISDAEAILEESQVPRFRSIVLQRYLFVVAEEGVRNALEYIGGKKTEQFQKQADRLRVETDAVRRLRAIPALEKLVQEIVPEVDVSRMVGKIDYMRCINLYYAKLDSPVAKRLLANTKTGGNPRRNR